MHLNGPGFHRTVIVAVCGHDRIPTQDHYEMDLAAMFRVDRGRTVCETPENARDLSYKVCSTRMMRRSDLRRLAILAVCGTNGLATQDDEPTDITAISRGDRFLVVSGKTVQNPWNSSEKARGKKKFRGIGPFPGEKPGKTQVCDGQSMPKTAPIRPKAAIMDTHSHNRRAVPRGRFREPSPASHPVAPSCPPGYDRALVSIHTEDCSVMKRILLLAVLFAGPAPFAAAQPQPMVSGLRTPESVAVAADGKTYVTEIGEFNKDGDGAVVLIQGDKATPFVTGLDDPKGIVAHSRWLFVADKTRIVRIDVPTRKMDEFAPASAFPTTPQFLNDIAVDPGTGKKGTVLYVSDSGDLKGNGGAVYRVAEKGKISVVVDKNRLPELHTPNGLALDGESFLLVLDFGTGVLYRVKLADGSAERLADGFGGGDGLAWDYNGRLFISDYKGGKTFGIARPGQKPAPVADKFKSAADICMSLDRKSVLVPDMSAGTLTAVPAVVPGHEVDESPLDVSFEVCFPNLEWTGWKPETDEGKPNQLRLILLTHAGDGSNRIFVPTQQGVIHVFPNDQAAKKTEIFMDLTDRVKYDDKTNEEGFLGLAFHPKFKENGEFFVFYTPKYKTPKQMKNIVSRFRVSKSDPSKGDPASEEILMQFDKPFWNHDGGTICFGPDGYLYVTHGDGGSGGDPMDNAQDLDSLLGKIHRIDVDKKTEGKNYAIPPDNPFVGRKDARPEIYSYGHRNIWRMAFDRKTGDFWAGEVGQNLFEEINLIKKGGNYGWRRRESLHPFSPTGVGVNKDMIDPIWEYHHEVGKSITGGHVYRGSRVPELDGHYIYGDYVTSKIWALKYDESKGRVVANRPLKDPTKPVYSFGEDEKGELYLLTASINGKGIYWLKK